MFKQDTRKKHPHKHTCRRVLLMDRHRLERCHRACLGCALRSMANASTMTLSTAAFGCPTLKGGINTVSIPI